MFTLIAGFGAKFLVALSTMAAQVNKIKKIIVPPGKLDLDKILCQLPTYILNDPPWTEEQLKKAYFSNWQYTTKTIQKHPGFKPHQYLENLKLSLEMFNSFISDLLSSVNTFRIESTDKRFWERPNRGRICELELLIDRGIFSSAMSSKTLIEYSRKIRKNVPVNEYEQHVEKYFDKERNNFINQLRNYFGHIQIIKAGWQISWSVDKKRQCYFLLKKDELLRWDEWNNHSKKFIKNNAEDIDVELLFQNHRKCVLEFYKWFHKEIERASAPNLSEYRNYEKMLNKFGAEAEYKLLLDTALKKKIDPYNYLDEYFDRTELDEIMQFPKRSVKQVDKIIESLDTFNACDDELRQKMYVLFKVRRRG